MGSFLAQIQYRISKPDISCAIDGLQRPSYCAVWLPLPLVDDKGRYHSGKGSLLGSILRGTGGSGMLAYPKAEVILVFLDKREIFRAALPNRLRV
jgi:hypothetical protein